MGDVRSNLQTKLIPQESENSNLNLNDSQDPKEPKEFMTSSIHDYSTVGKATLSNVENTLQSPMGDQLKKDSNTVQASENIGGGLEQYPITSPDLEEIKNIRDSNDAGNDGSDDFCASDNLSKAAIPIQATARRYLARREKNFRLYSLIVIQAYFRRWRCESYLVACIYASTLVQAAIRGWKTRKDSAAQHQAATEIQRIIRRHLAAS